MFENEHWFSAVEKLYFIFNLNVLKLLYCAILSTSLFNNKDVSFLKQQITATLLNMEGNSDKSFFIFSAEGLRPIYTHCDSEWQDSASTLLDSM